MTGGQGYTAAPTGGSIGSTLGKYGLGLLGFTMGGLPGAFIGSKIGAPLGNLVGSGLSSLFGPRGLGLLGNIRFGGGPSGSTPAPSAPAAASSGSYSGLLNGLTGITSTGVPIYGNRQSLYSTSNQGAQAFARNNTANVMGRNLI